MVNDVRRERVEESSTCQDTFIDDLESLSVGEGWFQFDEDESDSRSSDSTLICRLGGGFLFYRVIGFQIIRARYPDAQCVLDALDATDGDYDILVGMTPFHFLADATEFLEASEQAWLVATESAVA